MRTHSYCSIPDPDGLFCIYQSAPILFDSYFYMQSPSFSSSSYKVLGIPPARLPQYHFWKEKVERYKSEQAHKLNWCDSYLRNLKALQTHCWPTGVLGFAIASKNKAQTKFLECPWAQMRSPVCHLSHHHAHCLKRSPQTPHPSLHLERPAKKNKIFGCPFGMQ